MKGKIEIKTSPKSHYMQTKNYGRFMEKLGWENIVIDQRTRAYVKKIPILGSIVKIPRSQLPLPWEKIDRLAKEKRALFVKIEPNSSITQEHLLNPDYKQDQPILNTRTVMIDLTPIPEKIELACKGDVRTCLRKANRQNLLAKESANLKAFYALFEKIARERDFYHPYKEQMRFLWESFLPNATIILCRQKPVEKNPLPLAGCFIIFNKGIAYYKYAASTPEGRRMGASYLTLWQALMVAKKRGCRLFDLEGISDPRDPKTKKYAGITHFKKSWGGKELLYLGSFVKPHSTFYKALSKIVKI